MSHENCELCNRIKEISVAPRFLDWLYKLKDLEFQAKGPPRQGTISDIRVMLANLQTETPTWIILDEIKLLAAEKAHNFSNSRSFSRSDSCTCEQCTGLQQTKFNTFYGQCECVKEKKDNLRELVRFVEEHVIILLKSVYGEVSKLEEKLKTDSESFNDAVMISYKKIHSDRKISVVGPLGERPLHVCALAVNRFADLDFEHQGNFMTMGVINGIKVYLESLSENEWIEVNAQYGKDYCAAVCDHFKESDEKLQLPFFSVIKSCFHRISKSSKSTQHCVTGLYEGESILFLLTAAGAHDLISWILKEDKNRFDTETMQSNVQRRKRLLELSTRGLFFQPMYSKRLTELWAKEGWKHYFKNVIEQHNAEASSSKSYFGMNPLHFAASQGEQVTFDIMLSHLENWLETQFKEVVSIQTLESFRNRLKGFDLKIMLKKSVLNFRDDLGNTALHLAAWNGQINMYNWLVENGADHMIVNNDGLTPFTLSARYGIWNSFNDIWDRSMSSTVWIFGNVEKRTINLSTFDWNTFSFFRSRSQISQCLDALLKLCFERQSVTKIKESPLFEERFKVFHEKVVVVEQQLNLFLSASLSTHLSSLVETYLQVKTTMNQQEQRFNPLLNSGFDKYSSNKSAEAKTAVRLITMFEPWKWAVHAEGRIAKVVLQKWSQGCNLIHFGQQVVPYLIVLLLFGIMILTRKLNVLEQEFWWADTKSAEMLSNLYPTMKILRNPVRANPSEIIRNASSSSRMFGRAGFGLDPNSVFGMECTCGFDALKSSTSGRLQLALAIYGVFTLLGLTSMQFRLHPTDLDVNENTKISTNEILKFTYLNLESAINVVNSSLLISIASFRSLAGSECNQYYLNMEKRTTAIAALLLFLNLFIICKPFKSFGLLILTIFNFLFSDLFNYLLMYSILFVAFLLALQNLHNANHVMLEWIDSNQEIMQQIQAVTLNVSYFMNADIPIPTINLQQTYMAVEGCKMKKKTLTDSAFSLLEISFGDGLQDALQEMMRSDFDCAGFKIDNMVGYILIVWVFITNIIIVNMLIAIFVNIFEKQKKSAHLIWLLDVSYRVMLFEENYPELCYHFQQRIPGSTSSNLMSRISKWLVDSIMDLLLIFQFLIFDQFHMLAKTITTNFNISTRFWLWWNFFGIQKTKVNWVNLQDQVLSEKFLKLDKESCTVIKLFSFRQQILKSLDAEQVQQTSNQSKDTVTELHKDQLIISLIFHLHMARKSFDDSHSASAVKEQGASFFGEIPKSKNSIN